MLAVAVFFFPVKKPSCGENEVFPKKMHVNKKSCPWGFSSNSTREKKKSVHVKNFYEYTRETGKKACEITVFFI